MKDKKVSIIGAAIVDILAGPVDENILSRGSSSVENIRMSFGGDALNESVIMSRLGLPVEIITKVGDDDAGRQVIEYLKGNSVECRYNTETSIATGMNIVLVDKKGERSFLTNPRSSLRKLGFGDVIDKVDEMGDVVCFASMFVSPLLGISQMEQLFKKIKEKPGRTLVVDMTTAKNGETLEDIKCLLKYVDYLIPNSVEANRLTGISDSVKNAQIIYEAGAKCVIIKCGKEGCVIRTSNGLVEIPALPNINAIDTTGAGDAFVAGFVWGLKNALDIEECTKFACAVSSCVVEQIGAHQGISSIDEPMNRYKMYY